MDGNGNGKRKRPKPVDSGNGKSKKPAPKEVVDQNKLQSPFDTLKSPKQRAFLKAFCVTGQVIKAATAAKVTEWAHFYWRKTNPIYRHAYEQCRKIAIENLESEAYRRAYEGMRRLKFDKGVAVVDPETGQPYIEHEYSDTLLLKLLQANKPKKYRERSEHQHRVSMETPEQGDSLIEFLRQKAIESNGHGSS